MCECLDDVSLPPEASVHLQVDYGKLVYTYKLLRYTTLSENMYVVRISACGFYGKQGHSGLV